MTTLRIEEWTASDGTSNAMVCFDHSPSDRFPVQILDPFDGTLNEHELEWYFERQIDMPIYTARAEAAASLIPAYGENLFKQLLRNPQIVKHYEQWRGSAEPPTIEIVGSPEFHRYHWEALKDPDLEHPFALIGTLIRRNADQQPAEIQRIESPTINILIVTARPRGEADVGYRTISRPLLAQLRQTQLPVQADIVRPGTYKAMQIQLEAKGAGYYHAIHFDVHGKILPYDYARFLRKYVRTQQVGRAVLAPYDGLKGFIFLESEDGEHPDLIEAGEVAELVRPYQVPLLILTACQSGKQGVASESSLGSRLMAAGQQQVLAMGYSVTVTAAVKLMTKVYAELFAGRDVANAIQQGRLALYNDKRRRVRFNMQIPLEDWLLPVIYQSQPLTLHTRSMTSAEAHSFSRRVSDEPQPRYGFFGRDVDILHIERRILHHNLLLIQGMGGTGKSTLLQHLGWWWQTTAFVDHVFYFGWDARAWNRQQILHEIAQALYDQNSFEHHFLPNLGEEQQVMVVGTLRTQPHLLILDNLESISGTNSAVMNTLSPEERAKLHDFLVALVGGKTKVLLGSRTAEAWLSNGNNSPLRESHSLTLRGLDPEATSNLVNAILQAQGTRRYYEQTETRDDFLKLLSVCAGYPLAIQVVLSNLCRQSPADILAALAAGDVSIDFNASTTDKTGSLLECIDYSYRNLSLAAQDLLGCLTPFIGVFATGLSEPYIKHLRQQPELAYLPFDQWQTVLEEVVQWGLLAPHEQAKRHFSLHPILPYFLQSLLNEPTAAPRRAVIECAFASLYQSVAGDLWDLLGSQDAQERHIGLRFATLHYSNLFRALEITLHRQESIISIYWSLCLYYDRLQKQQEGLVLSEWVLAHLRAWPAEQRSGSLGREYVATLDNVAKRYLLLKQYALAQVTYQEALQAHLALTQLPKETQEMGNAGFYHQLGRVAQEQRQWAEATQFYQKALGIYVEFNDHHQAVVSHQLGVVAQEQRQWAEATQFYQKALALYSEFNDRYNQAYTYHELGIAAQEQGKWTEAKQFYYQALVIFNEFNDRAGQARLYHHLGMVAQGQQQLVEAGQFYHQALALKVEIGDRSRLAHTYHQLGVIAQEQGQWAESTQFHQQALALMVEFNDPYNQARALHQLGRVAQAQGQWSEARAFYEQALVLFIEVDDRDHQAKVYSQIGLLMTVQGHWVEARGYHLEALKRGLELQDQERITCTLLKFATGWKEGADDAIPALIAAQMGKNEEEVRALLTELYNGQ
jgi:tetratricopeptide (TPR) repeat protein